MINLKLAQELNWYKRMLLGARGTTFCRIMPNAKLSNIEAWYINGLIERSRQINKLLIEQIEAIDGFYASYGSPRTQKKVTEKLKLQKRYKAGEILTEEEYANLFK